MSSPCRRLPRLACSQARLLRLGQRRCAHVVENHHKNNRESGAVETARWKGTFAPRHGKAVEPGAWDKVPAKQQDAAPEAEDAEEEEDDGDAGDEGDARAGVVTIGGTRYTTETAAQGASKTQPPTDQEVRGAATSSPASSNASSIGAAGRASTQTNQTSQTGQQQQQQQQKPPSEDPSDPSAASSVRPLDAVLHIPTAAEGGLVTHKNHPNLSPPRYVHHFDTYSLVNELVEGSYTRAQAITVMKAVRAILAQNLDVAQENLVSKSDVENESYLFRAACSELSTEIRNNRRLSDEQMRQQRTHLQHEVDILTQNLNQELATLHDNVRGMFNDRRMAVSEEQRAVESAVQQISYKISIMLSSDAKSEIEAVRWILIRRSVLGIIFMAVLTLGTLRYATYVNQEKKREAERAKVHKEEMRRDGGRNDQASAPDAALILSAN